MAGTSSGTKTVQLSANAERRPAWRLHILADGTWFVAAAYFAFYVGWIGDQLFRQPSLGLRFQPAAERVLRSPALEHAPANPVAFVNLEEVERLLQRADVIVLDARPRLFYELGHLPGARCLSREQFIVDFTSLEPALRKSGQTMLIYCSDADCEDSALVAKGLQERGLGPLLLFPGGFAEWEAAGGPVEAAQ